RCSSVCFCGDQFGTAGEGRSITSLGEGVLKELIPVGFKGKESNDRNNYQCDHGAENNQRRTGIASLATDGLAFHIATISWVTHSVKPSTCSHNSRPASFRFIVPVSPSTVGTIVPVIGTRGLALPVILTST